jgi:hypothetical protein
MDYTSLDSKKLFLPQAAYALPAQPERLPSHVERQGKQPERPILPVGQANLGVEQRRDAGILAALRRNARVEIRIHDSI